MYWLIPDFYLNPLKFLSIAVRYPPWDGRTWQTQRTKRQTNERTKERTDGRTDRQRGESFCPSVRPSLRGSLTLCILCLCGKISRYFKLQIADFCCIFRAVFVTTLSVRFCKAKFARWLKIRIVSVEAGITIIGKGKESTSAKTGFKVYRQWLHIIATTSMKKEQVVW